MMCGIKQNWVRFFQTASQMTCLKNTSINRVHIAPSLINQIMVLLILAIFSFNAAARVTGFVVEDNSLLVHTDTNTLRVSALSKNSFSVTYEQDEHVNLPSLALPESSARQTSVTLDTLPAVLVFSTGDAAVHINRASNKLSFYLNNTLITQERSGLSVDKGRVQLSMQLTPDEKLYGGGQRVLGMDRRGHVMPLYNKAHYGYTTESNQMYFGLSAVMSSKGYSVLFDNTASGELDIGKTTPDELRFSAVSGRASYIIVLGETLTETIESTVSVTGKQPLPPRWLFGNFASRFGYKSQQDVTDVVRAFNEQDIPLDAVVLDLFWFGKDVKGHMGNLAWDRSTFPEPEAMISSLNSQNIKTVLITEPFILTTSKQWQSAVDSNALALNSEGKAYTFDFYFGNTGLVDVFSDAGQDWFWQFYEKLAAQGVAGWWGDLGEPEVHPDDIIHLWQTQKLTGEGRTGEYIRGDALHNAYGHKWAEMVFTRLTELQPYQRPFVLMRSGFLGSQRYGMVPWTGDVSRSWGGLKPQVELALQMSVFGMAYTHSDLGGFAGGDEFDAQLYTRWLQFGTFSPVFRPHAQDAIAPEPIFHADPVKSIARQFIKLRYAMLPYNYSLAFENALFGTPLMRPLAMTHDDDTWFEDSHSYYWGDALLVSPVTQPDIIQWPVSLPKGVWFDFFSDAKYQGGQKVSYPLTDSTFPVWVKAGAFLPMSENLSRTEQYNAASLTVHYWHDASVNTSRYSLYEDDGVNPKTIDKSLFSELRFIASTTESDSIELTLTLSSDGSYVGMPQTRDITWVLHGYERAPSRVLVNGKPVKTQWDGTKNTLSLSVLYDYQQQLTINVL